MLNQCYSKAYLFWVSTECLGCSVSFLHLAVQKINVSQPCASSGSCSAPSSLVIVPFPHNCPFPLALFPATQRVLLNMCIFVFSQRLKGILMQTLEGSSLNRSFFSDSLSCKFQLILYLQLRKTTGLNFNYPLLFLSIVRQVMPDRKPRQSWSSPLFFNFSQISHSH